MIPGDAIFSTHGQSAAKRPGRLFNRIGRFLQLDLKIPGNTIVVYIFIHWGAQSDQSTHQET